MTNHLNEQVKLNMDVRVTAWDKKLDVDDKAGWAGIFSKNQPKYTIENQNVVMKGSAVPGIKGSARERKTGAKLTLIVYSDRPPDIIANQILSSSSGVVSVEPQQRRNALLLSIRSFQKDGKLPSKQTQVFFL